MRILKLNPEVLGSILLKVAPTSIHAGHKRIKSTLQDYVIPSDEHPEQEFIRDLFTLSNDEIAEKWYGGKKEALSLLFMK